MLADYIELGNSNCIKSAIAGSDILADAHMHTRDVNMRSSAGADRQNWKKMKTDYIKVNLEKSGLTFLSSFTICILQIKTL